MTRILSPIVTANIGIEDQHAPHGYAGTGLPDESIDACADDERCAAAALALLEADVDQAIQTADEVHAAEMQAAVAAGAWLRLDGLSVTRATRVEQGQPVVTLYYATAFGCAAVAGANPMAAVGALVRAVARDHGGGQAGRAPLPAA